MRLVPRSALFLLAVGACEANDRVLMPDDERDAGQIGDAALHDASLPEAGASTGEAGIGVEAGAGVNEAGPDADASPGVATHADCDLNGIWIGRQNTQSLALLFPQFASNWYYLELRQQGDQVEVVDHMDCGIAVRGTVVVELSEGTTRALMQRNRQVGRKGSFSRQADGTCAFEMEHFWSVRGVSEAQYVPSPRSSPASLADVQRNNPLPMAASGSEDWDGDGQPGTAWVVSGIASGVRHSAQRDWTRWFSAPGYAVPAALDFAADLVVRAEFSNEEVVYEATNATLRSTSTPDASAPHAVTLRFLGRTKNDARAQALLKNDDFATCRAVQAALPAIEGLK